MLVRKETSNSDTFLRHSSGDHKLIDEKNKANRESLTSIKIIPNNTKFLEDDFLEKRTEETIAEFQKLNEEMDVEDDNYGRRCVSDSAVVNVAQKNENYREASNRIGIRDFILLKQIGKGAYGKVWLVRKKNTSDEYAMKLIRFAKNIDESFAENLMNERNIFGMVSGEHVVTALFSFIHKNYICFCMECMYGGDFRGILDEEARLDEKEIALPYLAELVLAIEY